MKLSRPSLVEGWQGIQQIRPLRKRTSLDRFPMWECFVRLPFHFFFSSLVRHLHQKAYCWLGKSDGSDSAEREHESRTTHRRRAEASRVHWPGGPACVVWLRAFLHRWLRGCGPDTVWMARKVWWDALGSHASRAAVPKVRRCHI